MREIEVVVLSVSMFSHSIIRNNSQRLSIEHCCSYNFSNNLGVHTMCSLY